MYNYQINYNFTNTLFHKLQFVYNDKGCYLTDNIAHYTKYSQELVEYYVNDWYGRGWISWKYDSKKFFELTTLGSLHLALPVLL